MRHARRLGLALLLGLALAGLANGHAGHAGDEGPQLETPDGQPALWGRLEGSAAPGPLTAAPWTAGALAVDGALTGYQDPALPAPGLAAAFRTNDTHLAVAMEYGGRGWFLLGVDQNTANRALIMMTQQIVVRHAAVGGHVDDDGTVTWCGGELGLFYPDPQAPGAGAHAMAGVQEDVQVYYPRGPDGACAHPEGVEVAASVSGAATRVEAALPLDWLGAEPGEVRHVLLAFEPARRFVPPKVTEQATRGDVNALLLRPGDDPAEVRGLLAGAPAWEGLASLAVVPAGAVVALRVARKPPRQPS